jgi:Mg-chelatase subunit ChlD
MRDNHGKVVAIDTTDRGLKDAREKGRVPLRASLKTAEAIQDKEKQRKKDSRTCIMM